MAGLYPNDPYQRIAWDIDGTKAYYFDKYKVANGTAVPTQLTQAQMSALNDETSTSDDLNIGPFDGFNADGYAFSLLLIFPQTMVLTHYTMTLTRTATNLLAFLNYQYDSPTTTPTTTTGLNGSWSGFDNMTFQTDPTNYRPTSAKVSTASILTGSLRIDFYVPSGSLSTTGVLKNLLWYGYRYSTASSRLSFWHPTSIGNTECTPQYFDWGDAILGTTETRQFRIRNFSGVTASNIVVSKDILAQQEQTPTIDSQIKLSTDNVNWSDSISVPNLGYAATSANLYIKRTTASDAVLGPFCCRLKVSATFA